MFSELLLFVRFVVSVLLLAFYRYFVITCYFCYTLLLASFGIVRQPAIFLCRCDSGTASEIPSCVLEVEDTKPSPATRYRSRPGEGRKVAEAELVGVVRIS